MPGVKTTPAITKLIIRTQFRLFSLAGFLNQSKESRNVLANEESVRSMDLFLNLDVQVESRNRDLKKHMKIYSSNSILVPPVYTYINI